MKYIAKFEKVFDWKMEKTFWRVTEIYDENGFNIIIDGWQRVETMKEIEKMNKNIKYKFIDESDFEVCGHMVNCTKANEKFEILENVVKGGE